MTTKAELLAKIKELQAQHDAMPDDKVNPVFIPNKDTHWKSTLGTSATPFICDEGVVHKFAAFRTREAAKAYGETFQTILELHALSEAVSGEYPCKPDIFEMTYETAQ